MTTPITFEIYRHVLEEAQRTEATWVNIKEGVCAMALDKNLTHTAFNYYDEDDFICDGDAFGNFKSVERPIEKRDSRTFPEHLLKRARTEELGIQVLYVKVVNIESALQLCGSAEKLTLTIDAEVTDRDISVGKKTFRKTTVIKRLGREIKLGTQ